jgi:hypothetical protein
MKNAIVLFATLTILLVSSTILAQKTATWKGGSPGQATNWNCAANWKEGRVPNEFSDVIIPTLSNDAYPVITMAVDDVNALFLMSAAYLRIEKNGALTVYEHAQIMPGTTIHNDGWLVLPAHQNQITQKQNTAFTTKKLK